MFKILNSSIHIIDYDKEICIKKDIPTSFKEDLTNIIKQLEEEKDTKTYKTRSLDTFVISKTIDICNKNSDFTKNSNEIAERLLQIEIETQKQVERLGVKIQKGSLLQVVLQEDDNSSVKTMLLATIKHTDFIDDSDFSSKSGFSKEKTTLWKSCSIRIPEDIKEDVLYPLLYVNTQASYWDDRFLELDGLNSDENNTNIAYQSIDHLLARKLKNSSEYTLFRNGLILYFRNHEQMVYSNLIEEIDTTLHNSDIPDTKISQIITELKELPAKFKFDTQFQIKPGVIKSKLKRIYKITPQIELRLIDGIENLQETISTDQDIEGHEYIKIMTTNSIILEQFRFNKDQQANND